MSTLRKIIPYVALAMVCGGVSVSSAAAYQGWVKNVHASGNKVFILVADGGFDGPSGSCPLPGGAGMVYAIDPSTAIGKAQLAIALAAKLSGTLVWAAGAGACESGAEPLGNLDLKG
jgi:hypothetical protein